MGFLRRNNLNILRRKKTIILVWQRISTTPKFTTLPNTNIPTNIFITKAKQSRKEASLFFSNVIGVILQQQYAEEGLNAFMKEYPKSAYFAQANGPLADYYLAKKDFEKALETLQKVNQYQLSKEENTQHIMKLGYAKFMTGRFCRSNRSVGRIFQKC
jgi:TolA-binding protein